MRDYLELCQLQNSPRLNDFVLKTQNKVSNNIVGFLGEYPNSEITHNMELTSNKLNFQFVITPIDGVNNFQRAHPFFSINILICKPQNDSLSVVGCCIIFPVFGDIIYAWQGKGAWLESSGLDQIASHRLRVVRKHKLALEINDQKPGLNYGCNSYHGFLLASGKIDKLSISNIDNKDQNLLSFLIKESGGYVETTDNSLIAQGI